MQLAEKDILVVGSGVSGAAAARLCLREGARVTVTDMSPAPPLAQELAQAGVRLVLGEHREEDFSSAQLIVVSPGVPPSLPPLARAVAAGVPVMAELDLGLSFLKAPTVMITGTNGKSTVTTLVGRMLAASLMRVFVGGNLGTPLCGSILREEEVDWAVLEVSSFQLDWTAGLAPQVGVLLNLAPDHLDRHADFEEYAARKMRMLAGQGPADRAVICLDDPEVKARAAQVPGPIWGYGLTGPCQPGAWLEGEHLVLEVEPGAPSRLDLGASPLSGGFNRLNLMAASLASLAAGADLWALQATINLFRGLPHRVQKVGECREVEFVDDSKATNVHAVVGALRAMERPTVLLLGGRDKAGDFTVLGPEMKDLVRQVICFGEAGPVILEQVRDLANARLASDLASAVELAAHLAQPGWTVLLSPGCTSFDAYGSYAQRGDHFASLVREKERACLD